jgi:MFS family permease
LLTRVAKKIFSYLLKTAIIVLAFIFIYKAVHNKNDSLQQFEKLVSHISSQQAIIIITFIVLLMFVNWTLESFKWQYLTRVLSPISVWQAIQAVFCGLTWAIFTPNRIGEYGGRIMFLPNRKRIHGIFAMGVGSFGQLVITNVLGSIAMVWFLYTFMHLNTWIFLGIALIAFFFIVLLLVFYFHIKWFVFLLNSIKLLRKYHRFFDIMGRYHFRELLNVMWFCLARFGVFSFQYYLVIHMLIPSIPMFEIFMMVFILFFIQSALPSLDIFDVGVRSMTASTFFAYVTTQNLAVIAAVSSIWLVNLIIPAILGSVFVFKLKFFDRNS